MISINLIENFIKHADLQSSYSFISITFGLKDAIFSLTVSNKIYAKAPLKKGNSGIGAEPLENRFK